MHLPGCTIAYQKFKFNIKQKMCFQGPISHVCKLTGCFKHLNRPIKKSPEHTSLVLVVSNWLTHQTTKWETWLQVRLIAMEMWMFYYIIFMSLIIGLDPSSVNDINLRYLDIESKCPLYIHNKRVRNPVTCGNVSKQVTIF